MKKSSLFLLLATLFFASVTYYFMYYADGGADGLSSFIFIILFGVLAVGFLLAFLLTLIVRKGQSTKTRNWIIGITVALPILGVLAVFGVFSYFTYNYQNQWEIQVESDKSALTTLRFQDKDFGITFNHVSGEVSNYVNGKPVPTPINPSIENGKLMVPVSDESYMDADFLIKLDGMTEVTLPKYIEKLNSELKLDLTTEKGDVDDFPLLPKDTEILMVSPETPYEVTRRVGKHFVAEKQFGADIIYFVKQSIHPENIWILIVSAKVSSAPAIVSKMSTDNYGDKNLWFHTLAFTE